MSSLGSEFPLEQQRVRRLRDLYVEIGPAGAFGLMVIDDVLSRAEQVAISGDVIAMLGVFQEMRDLK